ncbi:Lar family restriction alleviation protein [Enterobacter roggenkampii]|uniref:Lar family restriction alleviation protein n=1 Tax=Enterobacter roggenkampii TaxID=1812935 RepID=UPI00387EE35E
MSELKRCPFCGSKDLRIGHVGRDWNSVTCRYCGGEGPEELGREDAISSWNRRAGDEADNLPQE